MAAIDLTTPDNVILWTGEPGNALDLVIPYLITAASQYFLTETSLEIGDFQGASYTEKYNGNGQCELFLSHGPVTAVASVTAGNVSIPASPDGVQAGYVFDDRIVYLICYRFCRGLQNVVVSYTAGLAAIPADVGHAVDAMVGAWVRRRKHIDQNSQSLDGQVIAFSQKDVPVSAQVVIDRYKKRVPV